MKNPVPLKRHQSLVSFSKDHHFGLLLVWKIRQGLIKPFSRDRITNYVLYIFREDLEAHFKAEEALLFCKLPANDTLRKRAEAEHQEIYDLVGKLTINNQDPLLLTQFAETLEKHIRFEERELFNHLQGNIAAEELEAIALRMPNENKAIDEKWPDAFWQQ